MHTHAYTHVSQAPRSDAAFVPTLRVVSLWGSRWMIVPPSSLPARRSSGEGAGEPEKGQEHGTFAHVLQAPASRSFSRAAAQPSLGDNRRCHRHFHQIRTPVNGVVPTDDGEERERVRGQREERAEGLHPLDCLPHAEGAAPATAVAVYCCTSKAPGAREYKKRTGSVYVRTAASNTQAAGQRQSQVSTDPGYTYLQCTCVTCMAPLLRSCVLFFDGLWGDVGAVRPASCGQCASRRL